MGEKQPTVHDRLFELLKSKTKDTRPLYKQLMDALNCDEHIAKSRAGRKANFRLEEVERLVGWFEIAPGLIFQSKGSSLGFQRNGFASDGIADRRDYIMKNITLLERFAEEPGAMMKFLAADVPIFHLLPHPELIYFKLYCAQRGGTLDQQVGIVFEDFVAQMNGIELGRLFAELYDAYLQIPSVEVWDRTTVYRLLDQIRAKVVVGEIRKKETIALLHKQVSAIWDKHDEWSKTRKKNSGTPFELVYSRIKIDGTKMLLVSDAGTQTMLKLHAITHITTEELDFGTCIDADIQHVITHGTIIGASDIQVGIQLAAEIKKQISQSLEASIDDLKKFKKGNCRLQKRSKTILWGKSGDKPIIIDNPFQT